MHKICGSELIFRAAWDCRFKQASSQISYENARSFQAVDFVHGPTVMHEIDGSELVFSVLAAGRHEAQGEQAVEHIDGRCVAIGGQVAAF